MAQDDYDTAEQNARRSKCATDWLPPEYRAAIVFSIDDVHPAGLDDPYEAGGAGPLGALGYVEELLTAHPRLRTTLFVTPDWRPISVLPTRTRCSKIPFLREFLRLAPAWPRGRMRLDRHPRFNAYLRSLPRTEIAAHGLHHLHRGPDLTCEFQRQSRTTCERKLRRSIEIFAAAGLPLTPGMQAPRWQAPANLLDALDATGFSFVSSARDLDTPVVPKARCAGSGLQGVSMLAPERLGAARPLHFPVNFQATSPFERAFEIVEAGGLLSIKAHIAKNMLGHVMRDGLDDRYVERLHDLFTILAERYGDGLWWTSMGEIAARIDAGTRQHSEPS